MSLLIDALKQAQRSKAEEIGSSASAKAHVALQSETPRNAGDNMRFDLTPLEPLRRPYAAHAVKADRPEPTLGELSDLPLGASQPVASMPLAKLAPKGMSLVHGLTHRRMTDNAPQLSYSRRNRRRTSRRAEPRYSCSRDLAPCWSRVALFTSGIV